LASSSNGAPPLLPTSDPEFADFEELSFLLLSADAVDVDFGPCLALRERNPLKPCPFPDGFLFEVSPPVVELFCRKATKAHFSNFFFSQVSSGWCFKACPTQISEGARRCRQRRSRETNLTIYFACSIALDKNDHNHKSQGADGTVIESTSSRRHTCPSRCNAIA